jgi:hypothetical protein
MTDYILAYFCKMSSRKPPASVDSDSENDDFPQYTVDDNVPPRDGFFDAAGILGDMAPTRRRVVRTAPVSVAPVSVGLAPTPTSAPVSVLPPGFLPIPSPASVPSRPSTLPPLSSPLGGSTFMEGVLEGASHGVETMKEFILDDDPDVSIEKIHKFYDLLLPKTTMDILYSKVHSFLPSDLWEGIYGAAGNIPSADAPSDSDVLFKSWSMIYIFLNFITVSYKKYLETHGLTTEKSTKFLGLVVKGCKEQFLTVLKIRKEGLMMKDALFDINDFLAFEIDGQSISDMISSLIKEDQDWMEKSESMERKVTLLENELKQLEADLESISQDVSTPEKEKEAFEAFMAVNRMKKEVLTSNKDLTAFKLEEVRQRKDINEKIAVLENDEPELLIDSVKRKLEAIFYAPDFRHGKEMMNNARESFFAKH